MTIDACHFEAKKHAIRQTADGWVVSFVVHPNEVDADFAIAPLGTRYMVALVQIGDDELPVPQTRRVSLDSTQNTDETKSNAKARYASMSNGEQAVTRAALLPKDERFRAWATDQFSGGDYELIFDEQAAVEYLRERCCDGQSRSLIATDPECMDRFIAMETEFKIAVGEIQEPR